MTATAKLLGLTGLTLLSAITLIGCEKKEKDIPKEEPPQTVAPMNCDDASVKNSLIKDISARLSSEIDNSVDDFSEVEGLDLERRTLQRLGEIDLDLKNALASEHDCTAELIVGIPVVDTSYAERYYTANNLPSLNQRLAQANLKLGNGQIVIPIRYDIEDNVASLNQGKHALGVIANIMSASAYQMAKGEAPIHTGARPPITVRPLEPSQIARPEVVRREPINEPVEDSTPTTAQEERQPAAPVRETPAAPPTQKETPSYTPVDGEGEITIVETDETY